MIAVDICDLDTDVIMLLADQLGCDYDYPSSKMDYNKLKELSDERYRLNHEVKKAIDKQAEDKFSLSDLTLQKILSETLIELKGE